jgi:Ca2+-binding EF-hand superfamily protein
MIMNKLLIGGAAAAFVIAIAPAVAQPAPPPPPGVASGTSAVPAPAPQVRMKVMAAGTMTRDEVVGHVRDMFAKLDANRDGSITREEVDAIHNKMMGMRGDIEKRLAERGIQPRDRGAMFDRLDADHDGSISRQEYMAAQPQIRERRLLVMHEGGTPGQPGMRGMKMRMHGMGMGGMGMGGRLFDMADANHDGRVSLAEAEAAALAHFDRADLNHDGRITPEERSQAHELMRAQRRSS